MSLLTNPIVLCASIALGIVLLLIIVVVICCKRGSLTEREELMAISDEIESNNISQIETSEDRIDDVLTKMQENLEAKDAVTANFEDQQEENAVISYQELLNSLGAKSNIDVDNIELFEDELEGQIEISDINKKIIDAYQNEDLDREIYRFQNDYSNEGLATDVVRDVPSFDDFSKNISYVDEDNFSSLSNEEFVNNFSDNKEVVSDTEMVYDFAEGKIISNDVKNEYDFSNDVKDEYGFDDSKVQDSSVMMNSVPQSRVEKNNYTNRKFRSSDFISPVYGRMEKRIIEQQRVDEVEEIIFEDDSLLDEF
jgi:hypothetical protein